MDSIMTNGPGTMSLDVGLVYLPETNSGFEKKILSLLYSIYGALRHIHFHFYIFF